MSSAQEEISNNLNDIRKELRIANQLKLLELDEKAIARGQADDLGEEGHWRYRELRKILITDGYKGWLKANSVIIGAASE